MSKHSYTEIEFKNAPEHKTTPLNASNLAHIEGGISDAFTDIRAVEDALAPINLDNGTNNTGSTIKAGTYFYVSGVICKAITDIANGATLTSGTNYETVTVGALNELNSKVIPNVFQLEKCRDTDTLDNLSCYKVGNIVVFSAEITLASPSVGDTVNLVYIPYASKNNVSICVNVVDNANRNPWLGLLLRNYNNKNLIMGFRPADAPQSSNFRVSGSYVTFD